MNRIIRIVRYSASTQKIPLSLGYPFQFTLDPQNFSLHDARFMQVPFGRQLSTPQKKHFAQTLNKLSEMLNGTYKSSQFDKPYLSLSLKSKVTQIRQILQQSQIGLSFEFNSQSLMNSTGFLQIKPQGVSLKQKDLQPIHTYLFHRQKQAVTVSKRKVRKQLTPQQQLEKDLKEKMNKSSQQVKKQFQQLQKQKHKNLADKFITRLLSIGAKTTKSSKFEPYLVVEQVPGTMNCRMIYGGKEYAQENIAFMSKWWYWVDLLQSQQLRNHRKWVMFDFQFWNRGSIFPIKDFAAQAQKY